MQSENPGNNSTVQLYMDLDSWERMESSHYILMRLEVSESILFRG